MEFTYSEELEIQKKKAGRKQRVRKRMMIMTATGLAVGLVLGVCLGSMGKKQLKAEVASLTDSVIEKEKQVLSVRKEMHEMQNRQAIDAGEKELPWNLVLVNPWNEMELGYEPPELVEIEPDMFVDSRIAEPLKQMLAAADAEGLDPFICSAYRSIERQEDFNLPPEGVMCGNYLIKKAHCPEIRIIPRRVFFVRGSSKSLDRTEMQASIQEYLMLIESINIFKKNMA